MIKNGHVQVELGTETNLVAPLGLNPRPFSMGDDHAAGWSMDDHVGKQACMLD